MTPAHAMRLPWRASVLALVLLVSPAGIQAQVPPAEAAGDQGFDLPVAFSGSARLVSEFYGASGISDRRPNAVWRLTSGPQLSLFGGVTMGVDLLLSNEEADLRQDLNQVGLNPTWDWGSANVGDFSQDYSEFVLQGTRVRGAGLHLEPGSFRVSVQGGRLQRTATPGGVDGRAFERNMIAARVGVGSESATHLNLSFLRAQDDVNEEETDFLGPDTLLLDTIPEDLRPEVDNRPQENLVMGLDGGVDLLDGSLRLEGQWATSLITRDRLAQEVSGDDEEIPIEGIGAGVLSDLVDLNTSTSLDHAYDAEATVRFGRSRIRGGFERVGAGYSSLGLPYLIGDRRGYRLAGNTGLVDGRLSLQGQFRFRQNNLEDQRRNTVNRMSSTATAAYRTRGGTVASLTGMLTTVENDAELGAENALSNRAVALASNLAAQTELFGRPSVMTVGYNFQQAADQVPGSGVPTVNTHSVNLSLQLSMGRNLTLTPNLSGVRTLLEEGEDQENLHAGMRMSGRFLDQNMRLSAGVTESVAPGRKVFTAQARASYPLGFGSDLSIRARHTRHSAFGDRPSFEESFMTIALSRSF